MTTRQLIAYCTRPNLDVANGLAERVVVEDLATCLDSVGRVSSWFRWQSKVECADEQLLMIKPTAAKYPALEQALCEAHCNEVSEIVAVPITPGLPEYL